MGLKISLKHIVSKMRCALLLFSTNRFVQIVICFVCAAESLLGTYY
ncbi:hypothetical protein M7I_4816 [Glarea lozoyensis 74030]|uniref:Uncharacterized protein n=1 Tax=Glarea lozoyensis (strain ATCC 74030 / MF5533) TaxID=1104152 RepID=H0EQ72_GLAL7|nr:hypothetical protein M7I_4816 [Glarea lozoyensis 74030]